MAQFGYQILGFGSYTSAGGPGVWSNAGGATISSNRIEVVVFGNASAALLCGGYPATNTVQSWNGSSFTTLPGVSLLSANTYSAAGGGAQTDGIIIGGYRPSAATTVCEKFDGSTFETADALTTARQIFASAAEDKDTAWACGGYNPSVSGSRVATHEVMRSGTWTVQSNNMLTPRYYMAANASGSSGNGAAITGSSAGSSRDTKNEEYTYSSGSTGTWSTNAAITTGLDESPGSFGKTSADDLVVFSGEAAGGPDGGTYEYSAGSWTTGDTAPSTNRNNYGGGPTGNGITVGGYNETAGAYQDDAYIFTRAIST